MNELLVGKVREAVLAKPDRWGMKVFIGRYVDGALQAIDPDELDGMTARQEASCDTVMCFAGWAVALEAWEQGETTAQFLVGRSIEGVATDALDLTEYQAESLFEGHWSRFSDWEGEAWDATPEEAVRVLDQFVEAVNDGWGVWGWGA